MIEEIKQRSKGLIDSRYYDEKAKLEKKAKKGFCIICSKKLPKFRRKYCSDKCLNGWIKQFNPPFLWNEIRNKVFKRDKFTCVKCGRNEKELVNHYRYNRMIIADHIVPIALGGDEWDMKNIQTLCAECDNIKTREDMKKIAELRSMIKKKKLNVSLQEFFKQQIPKRVTNI